VRPELAHRHRWDHGESWISALQVVDVDDVVKVVHSRRGYSVKLLEVMFDIRGKGGEGEGY
jgi:hypothetical protein